MTKAPGYEQVLAGLKRITPDESMHDLWNERATKLLQQLGTDVSNYRLLTGDLLELLEKLFTKVEFPDVEEICVYNSREDIQENAFFVRKTVGNGTSGYWVVAIYCVGKRIIIFVNEI